MHFISHFEPGKAVVHKLVIHPKFGEHTRFATAENTAYALGKTPPRYPVPAISHVIYEPDFFGFPAILSVHHIGYPWTLELDHVFYVDDGVNHG